MDYQTLLVTGGAGFIGTNFIKNTLEKSDKYRVVNLDALTYAGNVSNLIDVSEKYGDRYCFVHGNIGDQEFLRRKLLYDHRIE